MNQNESLKNRYLNNGNQQRHNVYFIFPIHFL
jgi:hypothetical protein